jgi:hypothetical protein
VDKDKREEIYFVMEKMYVCVIYIYIYIGDEFIEGRSCGINDIIITPMVPAAGGAFMRR